MNKWLLILGGIFAGLFTATESAAVAVIYGLGVALFYYRELSWRDLPKILVDSAVTTGIVGLLLGMAAVFGWVLTTLQVPLKLANFILAVSGSRWVFLILVNVLLLVAGCFLNATAILVVALLRGLGEYRWPFALAVGLGFALAAHAVFRVWLGMPVPDGLLGD